MTAAQIAEIVGHKPKWLDRMEYDGHHWTYWFSGHQGVGVDDKIVELAFIGAAVRELERRMIPTDEYLCLQYAPQGSKYNVKVFDWTKDEWRILSGGTSRLAALVAALNESEAT